LGFAALSATAFGTLDPLSSLHVLTVGCVGTMTLAVMTRVTRGHTGQALHASPMTVLSYVCMILAGLLRPLAAAFPDFYMAIVTASGIAWMLAFLLFLVEHTPLLTRKRRDQPYVRGRDGG
ncbi:MAG TPA: NnrS family protein, partial [Devosia sp.]|nr:NnrS family protein [Devosia sp.]